MGAGRKPFAVIAMLVFSASGAWAKESLFCTGRKADTAAFGCDQIPVSECEDVYTLTSFPTVGIVCGVIGQKCLHTGPLCNPQKPEIIIDKVSFTFINSVNGQARTDVARLTDVRLTDLSGTNLLAGASARVTKGSVSGSTSRWFDSDQLWQPPWVDWRPAGDGELQFEVDIATVSSRSLSGTTVCMCCNELPWTMRAIAADGKATVLAEVPEEVFINNFNEVWQDKGEALGRTTRCATITF
eukprot:gb/GFBE01046251.1/.p1 GENE.gb/GFBE01046251.1/~~gb/GFBE01046251.1/.p1  ORF type:complete len:242 (+),score=31.44 gb/GFBE01046251.1/:1-726(+)